MSYSDGTYFRDRNRPGTQTNMLKPLVRKKQRGACASGCRHVHPRRRRLAAKSSIKNYAADISGVAIRQAKILDGSAISESDVRPRCLLINGRKRPVEGRRPHR